MVTPVSVGLVANKILVQVELSGDDCHWKVTPEAVEPPVTDKLKGAPKHGLFGVATAVPAGGVAF